MNPHIRSHTIHSCAVCAWKRVLSYCKTVHRSQDVNIGKQGVLHFKRRVKIFFALMHLHPVCKKKLIFDSHSHLVKHWHFGGVSDPSYNPKAPVFDKLGMTFKNHLFLQIRPLNSFHQWESKSIYNHTRLNLVYLLYNLCLFFCFFSFFLDLVKFKLCIINNISVISEYILQGRALACLNSVCHVKRKLR